MLYNPTGVYTLFKRETMRFVKVYLQTILAPLLNNMLFLGVFGASLATRDLGNGIPYLNYLIPGLCALGAINSAFQNPSSSLIIQRYQGLIQDLNTYPISTLGKILAYTISGTIRGVIVGFLTYVASLPFIGNTLEDPLMFLGLLALISFVFAALGLMLGLTLKTFDQIAFVGNFVLTPLIYFGGVFFPLSSLPDFLHWFQYVNPMVPMIDMVRFGFLGQLEMSLAWNIGYISTFTILVLGISYVALKKGYGLTE